jgi:hypothetical protein
MALEASWLFVWVNISSCGVPAVCLLCSSDCCGTSPVLVAACFVCKFVGSYFYCSSCVYDLVAMVHKKSNGGSARVIEGRMGS